MCTGGDLSLWSALRGCYEPYNVRRRIIGFDTFEGFPSVSYEDGNSALMKKGHLAVSKDYDKYLEDILRLQEES